MLTQTERAEGSWSDPGDKENEIHLLFPQPNVDDNGILLKHETSLCNKFLFAHNCFVKIARNVVYKFIWIVFTAKVNV